MEASITVPAIAPRPRIVTAISAAPGVSPAALASAISAAVAPAAYPIPNPIKVPFFNLSGTLVSRLQFDNDLRPRFESINLLPAARNDFSPKV